jgi:lysophospholipase L1-like esterase
VADKNALGAKLILAGVSTALALGILEAAVRRLPDSQRLLLTPSSIPGVAYQLAPNTTVKMPPGEFHVDSWGFRYAEFPQEKPAGELRVFALGDSIVFGQGTARDDFSAVLERELSAVPPPGVKAVRVINTGVPSYSTCQEHALLSRWLEPAFKPDLVLVGYAANDPEGARVPFGLDLDKGTIPPWWRLYHWVKGRSALLKYAVTKVSPLVVRLRGRSGFAPPVDPQDEVRYVAALHDPKGAYWPKCAACVEKFGEYRKAGGAPVLFVIFPLIDHLAAPELAASYARVEDAARKAGLSVLNLYPYFKDLPDEDRTRYEGDGMHPSEAGHRFVAAVIKGYLDKHPELLRPRR